LFLTETDSVGPAHSHHLLLEVCRRGYDGIPVVGGFQLTLQHQRGLEVAMRDGRRDGRRTRAGGVQAEKQQRYVQLIAQGVNNSEACRLVGIDRKTGNRWRYGRRVRNSAGSVRVSV
jgi:hypothetical protein